MDARSVRGSQKSHRNGGFLFLREALSASMADGQMRMGMMM
jgi:hypothetical protein